jgi:hypothetical protein
MPDPNDLKKLEQTEARILKEEEQIKQTEAHIREDERKIVDAEKVIMGSIKKHPIRALLPGGFNARELGLVKAVFTRKITRHRLVMAVLATIGVVLVWRGIWHAADELPFVSISLVSLLIGVGILWVIKRYTDL